jgi:hypothetical protein
LGANVQNFAQLGERVDFLCPFIWSRAFGLMRFRHGSDIKCATETLAMTRQAFGVESMSQRYKATILPKEKSKLTKTEKGEKGEEQSKRADSSY